MSLLDNHTLKSHPTHTEDLDMTTFTEEILTGEVPSTPYARLMRQANHFGRLSLEALQAGNMADHLALNACQTHIWDQAQQIASDMAFDSHVGLAAKWVAA